MITGRASKSEANAKLSGRMRRAKQFAFALLFFLLSLSGAIIGIFLLGRASYSWHGFEVELRVLPSVTGETRLRLVPLGEVKAQTHKAPIILLASLEQIQIDEIQKFLKSTPKQEVIEQEAKQVGRQIVTNFVLRQLLLSALGALIAPAFLRVKGRHYLTAMGIGSAATGIMLWGIASGFDGKAFQNPTYSGTLKQAPWVIQFGRDAFTKYEALSQKLKTVAGNLNTLYGRITAVSDKIGFDNTGETFRILHVSDIHNNPAAIKFLREVADQFKVSLIVDTGDLTDFGSPPETQLVKEISSLPFPYVFVAGNHDSKSVTDALAKFSNVTLLNGQRAEIEGLSFVGVPNPASQRPGVGSVDVSAEEMQKGAEELQRLVTAQQQIPDIVAVHDPKEAVLILGRVPLILCGHMHREYIETFEPPAVLPNAVGLPATLRTISCNAGTTGAAGGRYFDKTSGVPFSCAVLTFRRSLAPAVAPGTPSASLPDKPQRPLLRAIDLIVLDGTLNQYSIRHTDFNGAPPPTQVIPIP